MNKLPKEIYVREENENRTFFVNPEHAALSGETVILGVYKLVGHVQVSTQMKQEIVVKKSPNKSPKKVFKNMNEVKAEYFNNDPEEQTHTERNPLLNEIQVTERYPPPAAFA